MIRKKRFSDCPKNSPRTTTIYRAVVRGSSSTGGVAVWKAAGQYQPHTRAAVTGDHLERRAAARGAVFHVAQAARRLVIRSRFAFARQRKSLAIVFDRDAASRARRLVDRFDRNRDAARAGMLDGITSSRSCGY